MRKNVIFSLVLVLCVVALAFACAKTDAPKVQTAEIQKGDVLTVSQGADTADKVLEARFLNMLNHNFVYDDAFYDDASLVNYSMLALLDKADGSFLDQVVLSDYIFNMYGKRYNEFDFLGEDLPEKQGYVYIVPRGYNTYRHEIVSVTDNNDGSFTVITNIEILGADNTVENLKCETLFLKAEDSAFGFNMLYSDIIEVTGTEIDC
ncbi:MAG: hypothetical protein IJD45_01855 [Clostridia bacterium]|nr:hypothetical protein [Clostridia bacterium]